MNAANTLTVRVARKRQEAPDITSFELVDLEGRPLPAFTAGAHIEVHVPGGVVRPYSLCNAPQERSHYLICVQKEAASRGGSKGLHESVREGAQLQIGPPRNLFALQERPHGRYLLLAGGIGITPILCMAEQLAHSPADFDLHYAVRSRQRAAFLTRIAASRFAQRLHLHCSDEPTPGRLDIDALLASAEDGTQVYACGPTRFMQAVAQAAATHGLPDDCVHMESFAGVTIDHDGDAPFEVVLSRSGRVVQIPCDSTVTEALTAAGVEVPTSCAQGVCGTCLVRVLGGRPDHRDLYLSPEEQERNDQFTPCCSRSLTPRLVLEL